MFSTSNNKTNNRKKPIDNKNESKKENNDFKKEKENNDYVSDPHDLDVLPINVNSENSKLSNYESEVLEELKSIRKVSKNILKTLKKMRL